jgi:hypothetical protein
MCGEPFAIRYYCQLHTVSFRPLPSYRHLIHSSLYLLFLLINMVYEIEDEVDWSDSPLGPPSPKGIQPVAGPSCQSPAPNVGPDEVTVSAITDQYAAPPGSPLPFSTYIGAQQRFR